MNIMDVRRPRTYSAFQPPIRIHTVSKEHQYNKQDKPEKEGFLCLGNDKKEQEPQQEEYHPKQGDGITNLKLGTVIDLTGEDGRMSVASALSTSSSVSSSSSSSSVYDLEEDFDDYEGEDDGDDDHEDQNADEVVSTGSAYDTEDEEIKRACENGVSMCFSSDDSDSEDDEDEDEESQIDGHRTIVDSSLSTPRTRASGFAVQLMTKRMVQNTNKIWRPMPRPYKNPRKLSSSASTSSTVDELPYKAHPGKVKLASHQVSIQRNDAEEDTIVCDDSLAPSGAATDSTVDVDSMSEDSSDAETSTVKEDDDVAQDDLDDGEEDNADDDEDDEVISSLETWMGDNLPQDAHNDDDKNSVYGGNVLPGQCQDNPSRRMTRRHSEAVDGGDDGRVGIAQVDEDRPRKRQKQSTDRCKDQVGSIPVGPTPYTFVNVPIDPVHSVTAITGPILLRSCVSVTDEEDVESKRSSLLEPVTPDAFQGTAHHSATTRDTSTPASLPAPLLTPPSSPMSLPGGEEGDDSTTVLESKVNLILDSRLALQCVLRPFSPSFTTSRLHEDDEDFAYACLNQTVPAPPALSQEQHRHHQQQKLGAF